MSKSQVLSPKAAAGLNEDLLTRWGRTWFRWRSFSPVPFLLLFVLLPSETHWTRGAMVGFAVVGLLGEAIRLWAVGYAGSVTRTRGDQVPVLVHAGPYRFVRNPLYIGNFMIYVAVGFAFGFFWLTLAFGAYTILQYFLITEYEESLLENTFGSAYEGYRAKVSRWVPSLSPQIESSAHTFHLGKAIKSEKSTLIAIVLLSGLIAFKLRA